MLQLEKDKKSKTKDIRIRVSEEEKEYLKMIASKRGMTLSDYMRYCVLRETKESIVNALCKESVK